MNKKDFIGFVRKYLCFSPTPFQLAVTQTLIDAGVDVKSTPIYKKYPKSFGTTTGRWSVRQAHPCSLPRDNGLKADVVIFDDPISEKDKENK